MKIYDVIGIGFGPANLSLAIALQEQNKLGNDICFIEKKPEFLWHGDMLLENTTMQISFLKDLVTLRNPTSHFSFVNFLHHQKRLERFINLKTFYPSRLEFNEYLNWAASHFHDYCNYGEQVLSIEPVIENNNVNYLKVITKDITGHEQTRFTKDIILSPGGTPNIPTTFAKISEHKNVSHSSSYLRNKNKIKANDKVAIIGAGQSAAEIFVDVQDMPEQPEVDIIMRSSALKPADSSPFVNEIFSPSFTNLHYENSQAERTKYLNEFKNTNYAVVDDILIDEIYNRLYKQSLTNKQRFNLQVKTDVESATLVNEQINLALRDAQGNIHQKIYDHVILSTGYSYPTRPAMLDKLSPWLQHDISRNYQLLSESNFKPRIFTQGINESTHGISDSLLSILAIRSAEIVEELNIS